jgi:hypothetical protein
MIIGQEDTRFLQVHEGETGCKGEALWDIATSNATVDNNLLVAFPER